MRLLHNRRFWRVTLGVMLIPLAFIAYWPTPIDQPVSGQLDDILNLLHRHGIPPLVNYKFVEASANIALFIPLGFVSALAFPRKRWWQVGAFGLLVSGCMELGQLLFLHNRFASPLDLVTNTSGAVIGAVLATVMVKQVEARCLPAAGLH